MANLANIARPYALAAFEAARDAKELQLWKTFMHNAARIAENPKVAELLKNPEVSSEQLYSIFKDLLGDTLTQKCRNFLMLLAQNRRLIALPEINTLFHNNVHEYEKISDVRVVTATAIDEAYKQKLSDALTKRMNRQVHLHCEIDPQLIGGAVIHIGDHVIDGSVRGQLTRLLEFSLR